MNDSKEQSLLELRLRQRIADLEAGIRMAIGVLHKTGCSKKYEADYLRHLIGLMPGERVNQ